MHTGLVNLLTGSYLIPRPYLALVRIVFFCSSAFGGSRPGWGEGPDLVAQRHKLAESRVFVHRPRLQNELALPDAFQGQRLLGRRLPLEDLLALHFDEA